MRDFIVTMIFPCARDLTNFFFFGNFVGEMRKRDDEYTKHVNNTRYDNNDDGDDDDDDYASA